MAIKSPNLSTHVQLLFFVLGLVLFYLLLKPLLTIFLASIILAYVFYPLYIRIKKPLKNESLSVLITLFLIVIIFLMPFIFVASQIPKQVAGIYTYSKENIMDKNFLDLNFNIDLSAKTTDMFSSRASICKLFTDLPLLLPPLPERQTSPFLSCSKLIFSAETEVANKQVILKNKIKFFTAVYFLQIEPPQQARYHG